MWLYSFPSFLDYQDIEAHATPYILPLTHIALTGGWWVVGEKYIYIQLLFSQLGSVYSVVAVALERFYNICKPFKRNLVG